MFYFSCLFDSVPRFGLTMQDPFRPSDLLLHSAGPSACCNAAARVCECGAALVHTGVEPQEAALSSVLLSTAQPVEYRGETTSRVSPLRRPAETHTVAGVALSLSPRLQHRCPAVF